MTSTTARAAIHARIDNALDAMPPGARARTEIDVHVPLWALRDLLASEKHPEPEITAGADLADYPVGTIARDEIGRVFVRTDAQFFRWRTILGAGFDLRDDQAVTFAPVRILWVPVGEGEL